MAYASGIMWAIMVSAEGGGMARARSRAAIPSRLIVGGSSVPGGAMTMTPL